MTWHDMKEHFLVPPAFPGGRESKVAGHGHGLDMTEHFQHVSYLIKPPSHHHSLDSSDQEQSVLAASAARLT